MGTRKKKKDEGTASGEDTTYTLPAGGAVASGYDMPCLLRIFGPDSTGARQTVLLGHEDRENPRWHEILRGRWERCAHHDRCGHHATHGWYDPIR